MAKHLLSKSSFIKGVQCDKQLYLYKYHYDLMDKVTESQQAVFDRGTNVGILAQKLFPGGYIATEDPKKSDKAINKTIELLEQGAYVVYEAAFLFNDILVISDIIVKEGNQWSVYEVKSSTSISETYLLDASIQYYVLKNCELNIKDISIIYINNQYIRNGELDIQSLFNIESVKELVLTEQDFVEKETERLKLVLKKKRMPDISIGSQCSNPYKCSFWGYCWKDVPEYSVFDIANLKTEKKFELYNNGHVNLEDVPADFKLNENQRMQVESHIKSKTFIDEEAVKDFVTGIKYPVYFMDFETFMPAVPLFDNSRPYQQIPFQYSLHIQTHGKLTHHEFLGLPEQDPRRFFIEKLLEDIKPCRTILVYNQIFEMSRLQEIARDFPEFGDAVESIIARITDLMEPFRHRDYYVKEMCGSHSIK